jgi:6-phosphogluconate dehydrogenase
MARAPGPAAQGYLHCGPNGAGHFVKMIHNGIEYGLMAAYAEGLNILNHADRLLSAMRKQFGGHQEKKGGG